MEFENDYTGSGEILSVSTLNELAKNCLETNFPMILVTGEISNLSNPASGHSYFTLKDESSQIQCALFRFSRRNVRVFLEDGLQVLIKAKLTLYPQRGSYQLVVEAIDGLGDGVLRQRFETLKNKLEAEGLFDLNLKKPIPKLPQCIGIITSDTGAAVQDILRILKERFPLVEVVIYPSQVQGAQAVPQLKAALQRAIHHDVADVLILARGGGSLEDLWAFNDEGLARMIAACPLPVVSAIGHEVDFSISDYVADLRAPTPTAAAMLTTPDQHAWREAIQTNQRSMIMSMTRLFERLNFHVHALEKQLQHPGQIIHTQQHQLLLMMQGLERVMKNSLTHQHAHLQKTLLSLHHSNPKSTIALYQQDNRQKLVMLKRATGQLIQTKKETLQGLIQTLAALNPLATLHRGYSIVSNIQGKVLDNSQQVRVGEKIQIQLKQGHLMAEVTSKN